VALTSSLVVQLACDGQNKSIATQLKKQQKHPSRFPFQPFAFLLLCAFPIMKTGPKLCRTLGSHPTCATLKLAVTWYHWLSKHGVLQAVV